MNDEVRNLFRELADLAPGERERIWEQRSVASNIRAEVESLLHFDSPRADGFTACVADAAEEILNANARPLYCGPYRLVRLLGSGGMGAVYLAERTDGELQQQVAIKLLRTGNPFPAWHDRFLKERQLLASLNHPSIVRMMDAGHTADGRPYLVMEYVDGQPIDVYSKTIDLRTCLNLFVQVCDAVSHAHRHLIIHRDLKPSNILVDASGHPKLLDFGIAKLIDDSGDATCTVERLFTPNYASPEQLRGGPQSTTSDVYSLGAVLYKLVTGRSPHESETQTYPVAAIASERREVTAPSRLNRQLPADIDYIVRKSLRSEPEERYISVDALANDLRAFLDSRPIEARSGNQWYRMRRFVRRHWLPVAAALLVIASLSAGLYIANRQRHIAQARFAQLRQLSNKVFDLDRAIRYLPGSTQARETLVAAALEYLGGLNASARGDLDLAQEVSEAYLRVAEIEGVPTTLNLGHFDKAEQALKKADDLNRLVLKSTPANRAALFCASDIACDRMILAESEHREADAVAFARNTTGALDSFLRLGTETVEERKQVVANYGNVALAYKNMHMYDESSRYARKSVEIARRIPGSHYRLSSALSMLSGVLRAQGDLEGALASIQESRRISEEPQDRSETERVIDRYGILLRQGLLLGEDGGVNLGRPDEAAEALSAALAISEDAARENPKDYTSRSHIGTAALELGNIVRHRNAQTALGAYNLGLRRLGETPANVVSLRDRARLLAASSYALRSLNRPAEAKQHIDEALALLTTSKDYPSDRIGINSEAYLVVVALADHYASVGDLHRALETLEQLLDKVMAAHPHTSTDLMEAPRLSRVYEALGRLYIQTGSQAKSGDMAARRLQLWQQWNSKLPNNAYVRSQLEAARLT